MDLPESEAIEVRTLQDSPLIHRAALIELMSSSPRIIFICAEDGAGKTTLARQWVEQLRPSIPVAWVSYATHDASPVVAWGKTLRILEGILPGVLTGLARELRAGEIDIETLPSMLITSLILATQPAVVVFDDVHLASIQFQRQLAEVIENAPNLRAVVTSRGGAVWRENAGSVDLNAVVIGSEDLALTSREIAQLCDAEALDLQPSGIDVLLRACGGHALTVRMAISRIVREGATPTKRVLTGSVAVLHRHRPEFESKEQRRLAYLVALCPDVTPAALEVLRSGGESWAMIERFEWAGLGRIDRSVVGEKFRFHALMRATILATASASPAPKELRHTFALIVPYLEGVSDHVELLQFVIDQHLDGELFPFFVRHFVELSTERRTEARAVIEAMPATRVFSGWPVALVAAVLVAEDSPRQPAIVGRLLRFVHRELRQAAATIGSPAQAYIALARFLALRVARDHTQAARCLDESMRIIEGLWSLGEGGTIAGRFPLSVEAARALVACGRLPDALNFLGVHARDESSRTRNETQGLASLIHAFLGDMKNSEHADVSARGSAARGTDASHLAGILRCAESEGPARALRAMEASYPPPRDHDLWPAYVWVRAKLRLLSGEIGAGLVELDDDLAHAKDRLIGDWWTQRLGVRRAELLIAAGRTGDGRHQLDRLDIGPDVRLARALVALAEGDSAEALEKLRPLITDHSASVGDRTVAELITAAVTASIGYDEVAEHTLARARTHMAAAGSRLPLCYVPVPFLPALRAVGGDGADLTPRWSPFVFHASTDPLTAREREVLDRLSTTATLEQIAQGLFVSQNTVKSHLRNIYRKLGVAGRREAVRAWNDTRGEMRG